MKTLTEQYILKSRSGVYQDTSENRRKHRVGQHYGEAKKEGEEGKLSKREQREVRLASYKDSLEKLEDRLKGDGLSDSTREKIEGLRDTLKEKITKLEAKLSRGGKKVEEKTPEPKKDPWANKGYGMPQSNGKKLFEGLTKEQQASVLDRYMKESESMLRQETMNPDLVIGAIEEFLNDSIYETDDVAEVAEELKVSKNEAQAIIRHALGLEIKRLKEEGPVSWDKQDAFFKKGTDEYKLLDNWDHYHRRKDPLYQREMQKIFEKKFPKIDEWKLTSPNTGRAEIRAIADGKEVASINLNDTEHSTIPMLQTFMDKCQKAGIENRG